MILALINDAADVDAFAGLIANDERAVLPPLREWFAAHAGPLDKPRFAAWLEHVALAGDRRASEIAEQFRSAPSCTEEARAELLRAARIRTSAATAAEAFAGVAGGLTPPDADSLLSLTESVVAATRVGDPRALVSAWDVAQTSTRKDGLRWRLPTLDRCVSPLGRGDLIVVAAPPERGKSGFLISEASYMARQMSDDRCVLYFALEEAPFRIAERLVSAVLGRSAVEVRARSNEARAAYAERVGDRIKVVGAEASDCGSIARIVRDSNAALVIIDQLRNVAGFRGEEGDVNTTEDKFRWARRLSQQVCPVMVAHQAPPEQPGQVYLSLADLYGSRVAIQGAADVAILISGSEEPGRETARYIHVAKNKAPVSPLLTHPKFECTFDAVTSRYSEL